MIVAVALRAARINHGVEAKIAVVNAAVVRPNQFLAIK